MSEGKIEVTYAKASVGKRMLAHIIDIGLLFLSTAIIFSLSNMVITNSRFYKNKQEEFIVIKNESRLYENNIDIVTYVSDDTLFPTYFAKKEEIKNRLEEFYHNPTYFSNNTKYEEYQNRKLEYQVNGIYLFEKDGDDIVERNVDDVYLFEFYKNEINDYAMAYLVNNSKYFALNSFTFLTSIIQIAVAVTVAFIIFYLVFPLAVFKRGRQTIGMKLEKFGIITLKAENESAGKYVGRFFFMYFIFLPINFVSFLIPSFVSIGMMYFTKSNSSLVNYVFNDYMVDVTNQKIYFSALEREEAEENLKNMSIENKDLYLK